MLTSDARIKSLSQHMTILKRELQSQINTTFKYKCENIIVYIQYMSTFLKKQGLKINIPPIFVSLVLCSGEPSKILYCTFKSVQYPKLSPQIGFEKWCLY